MKPISEKIAGFFSIARGAQGGVVRCAGGLAEKVALEVLAARAAKTSFKHKGIPADIKQLAGSIR
eukprot:8998484-Pyramimonas_sp.AAC.1